MSRDGHDRRTFLAGFGVTAALAPLRGASARPVQAAQSRGGTIVTAARPEFMYVGSFTNASRGHGEGLGVYRRHRGAEAWAQIQLLKDLADPSFLIVDRQGRHLYSAHGDGTQATSYQIDQAT